MSAARAVWALLLGGLATLLTGCADENFPMAPPGTQADGGAGDTSVGLGSDASLLDATGESAAPPGSVPPGTCRQARAEALPARLRVMSADAGASSSGDFVPIDQLLAQFNGVCSNCHTIQSSGGFQISTVADFRNKMNASALSQVMADKDGQLPAMPPLTSPTGKPFSQRQAGDPIVQFALEVQAWLAAGKPDSFPFTPPGAGAATSSSVDFTLTAASGNAMTNMGTCIPSKELVASGTVAGPEETRALALDAMFAAANKTAPGFGVSVDQQLGLPLHLGDTDLFTLDTRTLANYGVIAYAPGYPLWSDNAGKIRYVRVPRGTSIHFDKATQKFQIPPNTRFYKTFLKPVVELADGSVRWKKMETRLILARPNPPGDLDQPADVPPALFGTYKWTDDETDAVLEQNRLNDQEFFKDDVVEYTNDEPLAADLERDPTYQNDLVLVQQHAKRHYAIPSSVRCIECHRGSPSRDFVLGFNPLQIRRRPTGIGGVIEPAGPDELSQLQRFIDYGLITGINSIENDFLPLEQSEGNRTPRNVYELVAQGYMLGNCAHCHNPHGEPSIENPTTLKDVLNFLPDPISGGIFQFPLELKSQRINRGNVTIHQIPYITPSLLDQPEHDPLKNAAVGQRDYQIDPFVHVPDDYTQHAANTAVYAPWRSLIYRNVDNAFAYTDDVALYPHMPRNTPGYDPRAKQIMSDWMVSIPAVRKHPELDEYEYKYSDVAVGRVFTWTDDEEQPYVEVPPDAPGYDAAVRAAQQRLDILHTGVNAALPLVAGSPPYSRYADPGDAFDILDPDVVGTACHLIPQHKADTTNPYPFARHPHWVNTDLTDFPPPWAPRRTDWADQLIYQVGDDQGQTCLAGSEAAKRDEADVVEIFNIRVGATTPTPTMDLGAASTTGGMSIREFNKTKLPRGLWKVKPGCASFLSSVPKVSDFMGCADGGACAHPRPAWMVGSDAVTLPAHDLPPSSSAVRGRSSADLAPDAPVYMETPGASVFKMICINCHGPKADSQGRMALNLATMTGGQARVADFRHGLQGPKDQPKANFERVFSIAGNTDLVRPVLPPWTNLMAEDVAARYMAWMALGGTKVNIPQDVISLIGTTTVLGERRQATLVGSANMLSNAKTLCLSLLGLDNDDAERLGRNGFDARPGHGYFDFYNPYLIRKNGDAELLMRLCTLNNHPPVHVIGTDDAHGAGHVEWLWPAAPGVDPPYPRGLQALIPWDAYGPGPVGNEQGVAVREGLSDSNEWPWCFKKGTEPTPACVDASSPANCSPVCPLGAELASAPHPCDGSQKNPPCLPEYDFQRWGVRGAINAAFSVFLYLETLEKQMDADPDYDSCELAVPTPDAGTN